MKKITLISICLLGLFINELSADGFRFARIIIARGLHSGALRARGAEGHDLQASLAREQERRVSNLRANLLETMRRNTELMNIEIGLLRARVQRLEENRVEAHRNSAIASGDLLDKPLR